MSALIYRMCVCYCQLLIGDGDGRGGEGGDIAVLCVQTETLFSSF